VTAGTIASCLRTNRLLLRPWRESDAAVLSRAVLANFEHLRPWMPWASDPAEQSEAAKLTFIRKSQREFTLGKSMGFAVFDAEERDLLGAVGLHARIGSGAREIGYWIDKDHARQGLATEAAGALTRLAFEHLHMRFMEIHCDPGNEPSAGVARKLGYTLCVTIRKCVPRPEVAPRDSCIWRLRRAEFPKSAAASVPASIEDRRV
jgi:RimJ/RimL family protein N-acetyltransferase